MAVTGEDITNINGSLAESLRKTPLEFKILCLIVVCLTLGFGTYVIYSLNSESKALLNQHRLRSQLFSETLTSGFRNIMLSGRAPYVRAFISEAREEFNKVGEIHLFNNNAEEIFPATKPHITMPLQDLGIKKSLNNSEFTNTLYPLTNEQSCKACHADEYKIRGAVKLEFHSKADWEKSLLEVVDNAFQAIMLSGKGEFADTLLMEVNHMLGVNLVQVYDEDASYVHFGDDVTEINEDILEDVFNEIHESNDFRSIRKKDVYYFSPLPNIESCHTCHSPDSKLRGILAMGMETEQIEKQHVINSVIIGFKNLMRLQKASYAGVYIDQIRNLSFVNTFQVFDNGKISDEGFQELWVPNPNYYRIATDDLANNIIADYNRNNSSEIDQMEYRENINNVEHLTHMVPIINDEKCQACHQPPDKSSPLYESQKDKWKVRSVVKVSTSMKDIHEEIQKNKQASIIVGLVTLFFVALLLRVFMRITVIKPLDIIGGVADKIGAGDLSVQANVKSKDEIGILAKRINSMIKGLQERLHLTKFVSDEALTAVKKVGLEGLSLGGKRKNATILETDIRGFTSMSEKMEPEAVVELLNNSLSKQTEIVQNCGGDIDKFIGDALLAVFTGSKMANNAVSCAIQIQIEIEKLNRELKEDIEIGIGINTGPVVMGAMGSKVRMDFTVIGDHVNTSARLCDIAGAGEIIISADTKKHLTDNEFKLIKLDPVTVKGKEEPIKIFQVIVE